MKLDGVVCHTNGLRTQRRGLTEEELNSPCVNPADVCQQWGLCSSFVRWAQASARPGCPQPASVPSRAGPCQGPAEQPGRRNPNPSFERFHVAHSEWFLMCPEEGMLSSWQGWGNQVWPLQRDSWNWFLLSKSTASKGREWQRYKVTWSCNRWSMTAELKQSFHMGYLWYFLQNFTPRVKWSISLNCP